LAALAADHIRNAGHKLDRLWRSIFTFQLPSYMAGMIGGLTALPCRLSTLRTA